MASTAPQPDPQPDPRSAPQPAAGERPAPAGGRRVVVYACTFLGYDQVFSPIRPTPGVRYVLFSDRRPRFARGWEWHALPEAVRGLSQTMANRYCKLFAHRLFPEADVSIYVDGNTLIVGDLAPLVDEFVASGAGIGLFRHKERRSVFEEFASCRRAGKLAPQDVPRGLEQLSRYRAAGLPAEHPFTENGIVFRNHADPGLEAAMALWWEELCGFTRRDQLSLPYVLHATGLTRKIWGWNYKYENPYFLRYPHRRGLAVDTAVALRTRILRGGPLAPLCTGLLYALRFMTGDFRRIAFWRGGQEG